MPNMGAAVMTTFTSEDRKCAQQELDLLDWLKFGERGISSETIFTVLTGINALGGHDKSHPYDPADFRRCRLLLERCPLLFARFHYMARLSREWEALTLHWTQICECMDQELPNWRQGLGSAPKTHQLMQEVLEHAQTINARTRLRNS